MSFSVARLALVVSILALAATIVLLATGAGYEQLTTASAADTGLIWG
ncbi:hypothetical protein GCM10010112_12180 [Actinoplanes lobatus]|uniref:Uncharacterized protein n=1 Tax=Actinoplanes lobatus TaxID=113568 RepID=A0A7W7MFW0_9ACTN|nr:hypothetical protein [Actinoplanes lobatus]MBB4748681.1 hypothetical protein [Actinoplanes lobatus]GGN58391.1 hypothetical protein GCM10010112_12180 [Actinoplanes lobatus]